MPELFPQHNAQLHAAHRDGPAPDLSLMSRILSAAPPWYRRGVVERSRFDTASVEYRIVPLQQRVDGDTSVVLESSMWPSAIVQRRLLGPRFETSTSKKVGTMSPFALSPTAMTLRTVDAMFTSIALDGPDPAEIEAAASSRAIRRISVCRSLVLPPCRQLPEQVTIDFATSASARDEDVDESYGGGRHVGSAFQTPQGRQSTIKALMSAEKAGAASDGKGLHVFAGGYALHWTLTRAALQNCIDARRCIVTGLPKAIFAILLNVLSNPDRLPFILGCSHTSSIIDLRRSATIEAARESWETAMRRAQFIAGMQPEVTSTEQQYVSALPAEVHQWCDVVATEAEAFRDLLRGPEAARAVDQWNDMLDALEGCCDEEPNREVTGLADGEGHVNLESLLGGLPLTELAQRCCVTVRVVSITSSGNALKADAEMTGEAVGTPANIVGPRMPMAIDVILTKLMDFESPWEMERVFSSAKQRRSMPLAPGFASPLDALTIIRPSGETVLYRRFEQSWMLVLRAAFAALRVNHLVVTPTMRIDDNPALQVLPLDDRQTITVLHFQALYDCIERLSKTLGESATCDRYVHVCGDQYHPWAVSAYAARRRLMPVHVVLHEADAKSVALNLGEEGLHVGIVCPAGAPSILFARVGAEVAHASEECEFCLSNGIEFDEDSSQTGSHSDADHSKALKRHWSLLTDLCATTTLGLGVPEARVDVRHVFADNDAHSGPSSKLAWAPFEPPSTPVWADV
jgi:hypothetical protein